MAAYVFGRFDRWLGIVMLVVFGIYMTMTIRKGFKNPEESHADEGEAGGSLLKNIVVLIIAAALIAVGADMLEGSSVSLSLMAGIPTEVVGVTVVALCTSLPELVTAITALLKGHGSLSLGNVIGANLFNLVLVSGVAVTISPFALPATGFIGGINSSLVLDIPVALAVMLLLTVPALIRQKLSRWQGVVLLGIYGAFLALQFLL